MRPVLAFVIALSGFVGMGWAVYKQRRGEFRAVIVAAFGLYALMFALGVGYYGEATLSTVKGGPGGFELTLNEAKRDIQQTGKEVQGQVVEGIRADVNQLFKESQKLRQALEDQNSKSQATLNQLRAIEKRLAPRRLLGETRERFVQKLKAAGAHTIPAAGAAGAGGDHESAEFANDIRAAIKESGWEVKGDFTFFGGQAASGVVLTVNDPANLSPAERALRDALLEAGITLFVEKGRLLQIVVGSKPF